MASFRSVLRMPLLGRAFSTTRSTQFSKISLIGGLGAAPEHVPTSTGKGVIRYSIATNTQSREGERKTNWWKVVCFAEEGTPFYDYMLNLRKGTTVYFEGDIKLRTYEDKEGQSKEGLSIVQRQIQVLRRPTASEEESSEEQQEQ